MHPNRQIEVDPILHLIPQDQLDRVLGQALCDIGTEFLGFTEIYQHLAAIIPLHWTVVDLGCAYAPQCFLFKNHKAYVAVDLPCPNGGASRLERFSTPNSTLYEMPISEFIAKHSSSFEQDITFAICSYVPPWGGDNRRLVREAFQNLFIYYPARISFPAIALTHLQRKEETK